MKPVYFLLLFLCVSVVLPAQKGYVPTTENLRNREDFRDRKFGVFIHWGLYSMLADGEWVMNNKNLPYREYAKLAGGFYPSKFDAARWVADVKAAGAKYLCITSRHHDGFSMFDTKKSPYNIVDATPFGRDILKELAGECHKQGIRLHFYYSLVDWYRTDYNPVGRTGREASRTLTGEWPAYHQFMLDQLTELLTGYGEIGAIWFDGVWDQDQNPGFDWRLDELYAQIHRLQPACMIINNHHLTPFEGEDGQTFERDLPGQNTAGYSASSTISSLPLETCETMNKSWGYRMTDTAYKSEKELIHYLVKAAGNNANLLMNVGPQPDGEFPAAAMERFRAIGKWLEQYGETIYGTRGGPVAPRHWGVTTQKADRLYVHILQKEDEVLFLPVPGKTIRSAKTFIGKKNVEYTVVPSGIALNVSEATDAIDFVVELELQ